MTMTGHLTDFPTETYNKQKTEILTLVEKDKKLQKYTSKEIKRIERNDNDK